MQNKWCFLFVALGMLSCSKQAFFNKYVSLNNDKWAINQPVNFDVEVTDTITPASIFINIRNTNLYPYSNLYLIVTSYFNHTISQIDTLEYEMADPSGRWLGSGFAEVKENKLVFKTNTNFPKKGAYRFSISHANRANGSIKGDEFLIGLTDVGMRIEYKK